MISVMLSVGLLNIIIIIIIDCLFVCSVKFDISGVEDLVFGDPASDGLFLVHIHVRKDPSTYQYANE